MNEYSLLKLERFDDGVVLMTLDRPPLNLMNTDLLFELRDAFEELSADPDMRAVVLTGSQRAFCAGADVTSFSVLPKGTNEPLPARGKAKTKEDALLTHVNKWLIAHPESGLGDTGAFVGLVGENIKI